MLGFFKKFLRPRPRLAIDPYELLQERPPRRFWHSTKGSMVAVSVPDLDGARLVLLFQRPIGMSDVQDGKLVPAARSEVKRRGGKRQTSLMLSLESAETLHAVLGEALKDAKAKQRRKLFSERAFHILSAYVAKRSTLASAQ